MPKDMQTKPEIGHNNCPAPVLFDEIDGDFALMIQAGTYKQAPLARRGADLYAKLGSGYVRLKAHGQTSKDKVFWKELLTVKDWTNGYHGLELVQ